jgi:tetratricopeptide (TPR) repeat protein
MRWDGAALAGPSSRELRGGFVRTRLELLLRSRNVQPLRLSRLANYSRQHLLAIRMGGRSSARCETAIVHALRVLVHSEIPANEVFEPSGTPIATLLSKSTERSRVKRGRPRRRRSRATERPETLAGTLESLPGPALRDWLKRALATPSATTEQNVRVLLDAAGLLLDRQPSVADELARTAVMMTALLKTTPVLLLAALQVYAGKTRANALRMMGRYEDALSVLGDAEQSFLAATYCTLELAQLRYTRATVLFKMECWPEAMRAAEQAREIFAIEHDRSGALHAQVIQGCILVEQGQLDAARGLFLTLRKPLAAVGDAETLARLWLNLGACDLKRGDAFSARHWVNRATAVFRERTMTTEVIRAGWCGAKVSLLEGKRKRALTELRRAMAAFEAIHMPLDAGFVAIDLLSEFVRENDTPQKR